MGETHQPGATPGLSHDEWLRLQLFQRRTVMLTGPLDDPTTSTLSMALMTLDADGDGAVQLRIDSGGGSVTCALALMDVIDLLGVPVRALCTGQAVGPAVGVFAVCPVRTVAPHARLGIIEPTTEFGGTARQIEQRASAHLDQWTAFCRRLAEATGQPLDRISEDAGHGLYLTAEDALEYGLADEMASPEAPVASLAGHPIGFGTGHPSWSGYRGCPAAPGDDARLAADFASPLRWLSPATTMARQG